MNFYTPVSDILKQYIEGYYFLTDLGEGDDREYLTFPNNYCIVTTNLNSKVELGKNKITIKPFGNQIFPSFVYRYVNPILVHYKNPFQEITIYFKPLGINYFVDNLEVMFRQKKMMEFNPNFPDYALEMSKIFHLKKRKLQIQALEQYWLSKLKVKDLVLMKTILSDLESNMKIEDIAEKHHISRKHLTAMVKKSLGKSPVEYRKIYRFRKAVNSKKDLKNLTELSYESFFFDQSHLIKDFKSLTSINPNLFFKKVNTGNKNIWLLLNR